MNGNYQYKKSNLLTILMSIFICIICFFPAVPEMYTAKLILMALIGLFSLILFGMTYMSNVLIWVLAYIVMNAIFLISGELRGNPALQYYGNVYLLEPILYTLFILPAFKYIDYKVIDKIFIRLLLAIDIYILLAVILFRLGYDLSFMTNLPTGLEVNTYNPVTHTYDGYLAIKSNNIVAAMFLAPYVTVQCFDTCRKDHKLIILTLILTAITSIIYGRRSLIAVILLCFILAARFKEHYIQENSQTINKFIKFCIVILTMFLGGYIFLRIFGKNIRIGNLSGDVMTLADSLRESQISSLLKGWSENPFLGKGYAANASIIRSDIPGMYEYTYFARLFQTGILGSIIYASLMLYIVWAILNELKVHYYSVESSFKYAILAIVVGYIGYMLSNGTNPILDNFDGCFYLFYPLGVINSLEYNFKLQEATDYDYDA